MAKLLTRLGPTQLGVTGVAESSLCSPASGTRFELRHIMATNTDTSTHYLCISIGADAAATRIIDQVAITANTDFERFVLVNLTSSDILCASADAASKVTLTMDGYKYDQT